MRAHLFAIGTVSMVACSTPRTLIQPQTDRAPLTQDEVAPSPFAEKLVATSLSGYDFTLYTDGTVVYTGRDRVAVRGQRVKRIARQSIDRARALIAAAGFRELSLDCCNCSPRPSEILSDAEGAVPPNDGGGIISVAIFEGGERRIDHALECKTAPKTVLQLAHDLRDLVDVSPWTGRQSTPQPP